MGPVSNRPLRVLARTLRGGRDPAPRRATIRASAASAAGASASIFLVLRRMRTPLIVLIVIFAVTVLGLTLIPGQDDQGRPLSLVRADVAPIPRPPVMIKAAVEDDGRRA